MEITGVLVRPVTVYRDSRGWLAEFFREDELPEDFRPVMGYVSVTHPGVIRGPHEHREQTDAFVFISGCFELHLWENRPQYPQVYTRLCVGEENPCLVLVPPGVVHGYKNVGDQDAFVYNFPNCLYKGKHRQEEVDEIRHEDDLNSRFKI